MAGLTAVPCTTACGVAEFSWDSWGLGSAVAEDGGVVDMFIAEELEGTFLSVNLFETSDQ